MKSICPERLAAKCQAIDNLDLPVLAQQFAETPRLRELLWWLQYMFAQPGGAVALVQQLIDRFPERFCTAAMRDVGTPRGGKYSFEQCLKVWRADAPHVLRSEIDGRRAAELRQLAEDAMFAAYNNEQSGGINESAACAPYSGRRWDYRGWLSAYARRETPIPRDAAAIGLEAFNYEFLNGRCRAAAKDNLVQLLTNWCEDSTSGFKLGGPWYCPALIETLFEFMDARARQVRQSIAETEVTRIVFRELDFAFTQNVPVPIVGDSRFGKTKSVSAWSAMHPGRVRLVTVPEDGSESKFFEAHADALGIHYTNQTRPGELKRAVEFVLRYSRLGLLYDESHFLTPQNYSRTTPPKRLNWVRCQVIDKGYACAFFATPQSYKRTFAEYVRVTGYNMEQWLGRLAPPVILPGELCRDEMLAIAKNQFGDIDPDLLAIIAARAMQSEGYLKSMEIVAKRARFLARESGRMTVTLPDVQAALSQMLPATIKPARQAEDSTLRPGHRRSLAVADARSQPLDAPVSRNELVTTEG